MKKKYEKGKGMKIIEFNRTRVKYKIFVPVLRL